MKLICQLSINKTLCMIIVVYMCVCPWGGGGGGGGGTELYIACDI